MNNDEFIKKLESYKFVDRVISFFEGEKKVFRKVKNPYLKIGFKDIDVNNMFIVKITERGIYIVRNFGLSINVYAESINDDIEGCKNKLILDIISTLDEIDYILKINESDVTCDTCNRRYNEDNIKRCPFGVIVCYKCENNPDKCDYISFNQSCTNKCGKKI